MGRRQKLNAAKKLELVRYAKAHGHAQACRHFGVSRTTVRRIILETPEPGPGEHPGQTRLDTATKAPPVLKSTRVFDTSSRFVNEPREERSSDADAARAGANGKVIEEHEGEPIETDSVPRGTSEPEPARFSAKAVVGLVEAAVVVVGFGIAHSNGQEFTKAHAETCKFTPDEEELLIATAEPACEQLNALVATNPWIGLAVFGVAAVAIGGKKLAKVHTDTKPIEPEKQTKPL